ncbi:MAG: hypothetical protein ACLGHW_06720 [Gammaproteobacteria bacterium]|jgi:hypothetical protein
MNAIRAHCTHWLRRCAGACLWTCTAAAAALVLLVLFVLASEPAHAAADLRTLLASPLNIVRLVLLTACLALWGYIVHAARDPGRQGFGQREHA